MDLTVKRAVKAKLSELDDEALADFLKLFWELHEIINNEFKAIPPSKWRSKTFHFPHKGPVADLVYIMDADDWLSFHELHRLIYQACGWTNKMSYQRLPPNEKGEHVICLHIFLERDGELPDFDSDDDDDQPAGDDKEKQPESIKAMVATAG